MKIIIKNKYYLFKFNTENKKIKFFAKSKTIGGLEESLADFKSSNYTKYEWVLLKFSKVPEFYTDNSKIKTIGGPIKISIKIYQLSKTNKLKQKYEKELNRFGKLDPDKRNAQFLYITDEYYKKGIKSKDIESVGLFAVQNKLEKRLLAPKLINQVL